MNEPISNQERYNVNRKQHTRPVRKKRSPEENIMRTMYRPASSMFSLQRPPLPTEAPIALYGRQSTLGQLISNTISFDYQIEEQKKYLQEMGWSEDLIVEYFQDFAVSGTLGFGLRVGITQLLEDIEAGKIKAVYSFLEDRLFRDENMVNVSRFIDACHRHKTVVITSRYVYFMTDERDRDMFRLECERAWKAFKNMVYDRLMPMKVYASHRGFYDSRAILPGYLVDKTSKDSPTYKKYIIYEPHAKMVRWIFNRYIELQGNFQALRHEMDEMSGPHFEGQPNNHWSARTRLKRVPGGYRIASESTLRTMLTNKTYLGTWVTGDMEYPNNHAAIIDAKTWEIVQALVARSRVSRPVRSETKVTYHNVIRGLVRHPKDDLNHGVSIDSKTHQLIIITFSPTGLCYGRKEIYPADIIQEAFLFAFTWHIQHAGAENYEQAVIDAYNAEMQRRKSTENQLADVIALYDQIYEDLYGRNRRKDLDEKTKARMIADLPKIKQEQETLERALNAKPKEQTFPALISLLAELRDQNDNPEVIQKAINMIQLFTIGIDVKPLSTHLFRVDFEWVAWPKDSAIIWRKAGSRRPLLTEEEIATFRELHRRKASREEFLAAFPTRSVAALRTYGATHLHLYPYSIRWQGYKDTISGIDLKVLQEYHIDVAQVDPNHSTVFWQNANSVEESLYP